MKHRLNIGISVLSFFALGGTLLAAQPSGTPDQKPDAKASCPKNSMAVMSDQVQNIGFLINYSSDADSKKTPDAKTDATDPDKTWVTVKYCHPNVYVKGNNGDETIPWKAYNAPLNGSQIVCEDFPKPGVKFRLSLFQAQGKDMSKGMKAALIRFAGHAGSGANWFASAYGLANPTAGYSLGALASQEQSLNPDNYKGRKKRNAAKPTKVSTDDDDALAELFFRKTGAKDGACNDNHLVTELNYPLDFGDTVRGLLGELAQEYPTDTMDTRLPVTLQAIFNGGNEGKAPDAAPQGGGTTPSTQNPQGAAPAVPPVTTPQTPPQN